MKDEIRLRPVWDAVLDIYKAFAAVCSENHLRFYLGYGSVLGAVRHGGFIPWDDDMDVIMPRPDYERFCEMAAQVLPSHFKLVTIFNTKEFVTDFAKIQDSRQDVYERVRKESGHPLGQGIFLDIFPIDGVPSCRLQQCARKVYYQFFQLKWRYVMKIDFGTWKSKLARIIGFFAQPFYPRIESSRDYEIKRIRRFGRSSYQDATLCGLEVDFVNKYKDYIPFPKAWIGEAKIVKFEGLDVPIPNMYEDYLRFNYGDYMKLPPEEKRHLPTHFDERVIPWKFGPTNS